MQGLTGIPLSRRGFPHYVQPFWGKIITSLSLRLKTSIGGLEAKPFLVALSNTSDVAIREFRFFKFLYVLCTYARREGNLLTEKQNCSLPWKRGVDLALKSHSIPVHFILHFYFYNPYRAGFLEAGVGHRACRRWGAELRQWLWRGLKMNQNDHKW